MAATISDDALKIDANNNKASSYDANDFQFVFGYGDSAGREVSKNAMTGVQSSTRQTSTGYDIEIKVMRMHDLSFVFSSFELS
ncbi:MAG: sugar-binding protein [Trueperaceae bacterium]